MIMYTNFEVCAILKYVAIKLRILGPLLGNRHCNDKHFVPKLLWVGTFVTTQVWIVDITYLAELGRLQFFIYRKRCPIFPFFDDKGSQYCALGCVQNVTYGPGEEPKKKQTSMTWPTAYTTACSSLPYTSRDTMNNRPIGVTIGCFGE